jgi:general secretion pathway protein B
MSFILDALKKSETERQRQNAPGFADVPEATDPPRAPRWLWILGGLLAVNLVVLLGVMLKPEMLPETAGDEPARPADALDTAPERSASFSEMVVEAKKKQANADPDLAKAEGSASEAPVEARPELAAPLVSRVATSYATFNELRANGTIVLPDLHLDIHVYSAQPAERFVFVNMNKYRERATLAEGPLVKEITPDGVILEHLGNGFILPRE